MWKFSVFMTTNVCVLTSGGDAQGMNAAVRSVVRTALDRGITVYAALEGYRGLVTGGEGIRRLKWGDVGGILHRGGTIIGTARSQEFRERDGRRQAALNLVKRGINKLVVIGGDGSLTGANLFREEWPSLLEELIERQELTKAEAKRCPRLIVVGLVGSIDNDMAGTDMTIGADTALIRITEAIDAISSTAASHQRTFVVEVMGRNCGYLALMSALATGADWVVIPESPPRGDVWEEEMCQVLLSSRKAGRRDSIVVVAEGAIDDSGRPITCNHVKDVLQERLGQDTRITILGHVQRGGAPSAFDRYMSTVLGHAAIETLVSGEADEEAKLIGMRQNRIQAVPLMKCVEKTEAVRQKVKEHAYAEAIRLRGSTFEESIEIFETLAQAHPKPPTKGQKRLRIAVMNASGPAPGMNTATRAAVRLGLDAGHIILGIRNGFDGFRDGAIEEMDWMSVNGWMSRGGSELGTTRAVPQGADLYHIARSIEEHAIDALLIIGGWAGYEAAHTLYIHRLQYPAFDIPTICLPASINNNLPGSEFSIGADTALNSIVEVVDKIKQSAVASNRAFVIQVMGRYCGYLALMSGLATGAERVYLHEEGVTLKELNADVDELNRGFSQGKRVGLLIRNEYANPVYTTSFMRALFEEEGGGVFSVRDAILGHLQQGGDPSPFDRIQANRLARKCITFLIEQAEQGEKRGVFIGLERGRVRLHDLDDFPRMVERKLKRPKQQWWMALRPIASIMAQPNPQDPSTTS